MDLLQGIKNKICAGKSMVKVYIISSEDDMMYFYVFFLDKMKRKGDAFMLIVAV